MLRANSPARRPDPLTELVLPDATWIRQFASVASNVAPEAVIVVAVDPAPVDPVTGVLPD